MSLNIQNTVILEDAKEKDLQIAECVRSWGGSASIALLDPSCRIFKIEGIRGIIGYRLALGCAVVFGDPLCAEEEQEKLALAFKAHCETLGWGMIYVTASLKFADIAMKSLSGSVMEAAEELFCDPSHDPLRGAKGRLLRGKVRQALRHGLVIEEYLDRDPLLEKQIEDVGVSWLASRKGPQIYLADVHLFRERIGKRWFYAKKGDDILGVLLLSELRAKRGWLVQLVMVKPEAPNGTSELLVTKVIECLREENCHFLAFGIAQIESLGEVIGLGKVSTWLARFVFKTSKKVFSLDGRRKYWQKFQPSADRSLIVFGTPKIGIRQIIAMMRALNVGI